MSTDKIPAPLYSLLDLSVSIFRWSWPTFIVSGLVALFWSCYGLLYDVVPEGALGGSRWLDVLVAPLWFCSLLLLGILVIVANPSSDIEELGLLAIGFLIVSFLVALGWGIMLGLWVLSPVLLYLGIVAAYGIVEMLKWSHRVLLN